MAGTKTMSLTHFTYRRTQSSVLKENPITF